MAARNAAERGPLPQGSLHAEHRNRNRGLRELEWKTLPCIKLPRPSFRWNEGRRNRKLLAIKDMFEVQAAGWRLRSVEDLPAALRPDPAFRRFHPIASGLLMLDDLGNAQGFADGEAAVLRDHVFVALESFCRGHGEDVLALQSGFVRADLSASSPLPGFS
jgi:hypothetical protein